MDGTQKADYDLVVSEIKQGSDFAFFHTRSELPLSAVTGKSRMTGKKGGEPTFAAIQTIVCSPDNAADLGAQKLSIYQ